MDVPLRVATDPRWLPRALEQLDNVLIDHAHCEKKAAANALSLLQTYPDVPGLPLAMARLAREESAHLAKVLRILEARGLPLGRDEGDPYAQALHALVRRPQLERRLDRFLVAAIIEARSCERLTLLAHGLKGSELHPLYVELARSEHGHQELFLRFAARAHGAHEAIERLEQLCAREAVLLGEIGIRAAIH
jgi:tRNA 2-(methylsulfanyl)-N6-isopentenyladenosine37 hydroxylase